MNRMDYFIRRILLIIPTFIGITLVCFTLIQFIPGGPVEQMIMRMKGVGAGEFSSASQNTSAGISPDQRKAIEIHFGFDKPFYQRYWKWLVTERMGMKTHSYAFSDKTAWEMIRSRMGVSLVFGITGFLLSYLICIPLGILKALRHNTLFDFTSSLVIFVGYAIPPFALGMVLKMLFSGTVEGLWDIFPAAGFHSENFQAFSFWSQAKDIFMHMFLPTTCYVVGNFAILTLLMKNALLEQISRDYVRTVLARGGTRTVAVWRHALRNALIPIVTGIGAILTVMFAGAVIIEQVFEIPGMGRLSLEAVVGRDYPVFMGIVSLTALLGLLGNLLSDFTYMWVDPRIDFQNKQ